MPTIKGTPITRAIEKYREIRNRDCPATYNAIKRHYYNGDLPFVVKVPGQGLTIPTEHEPTFCSVIDQIYA